MNIGRKQISPTEFDNLWKTIEREFTKLTTHSLCNSVLVYNCVYDICTCVNNKYDEKLYWRIGDFLYSQARNHRTIIMQAIGNRHERVDKGVDRINNGINNGINSGIGSSTYTNPCTNTSNNNDIPYTTNPCSNPYTNTTTNTTYTNTTNNPNPNLTLNTRINNLSTNTPTYTTNPYTTNTNNPNPTYTTNPTYNTNPPYIPNPTYTTTINTPYIPHFHAHNILQSFSHQFSLFKRNTLSISQMCNFLNETLVSSKTARKIEDFAFLLWERCVIQHIDINFIVNLLISCIDTPTYIRNILLCFKSVIFDINNPLLYYKEVYEERVIKHITCKYSSVGDNKGGSMGGSMGEGVSKGEGYEGVSRGGSMSEGDSRGGSMSEGDSRGGSNSSSNYKGVSNSIDKQQGVSNSIDKQQGVSSKEGSKEGVSNKDTKLEGDNDSTNKQQGVNISTNKQQGVNNLSNTLHPVNNTANNTLHPVNNLSNTLHPLNNTSTKHPLNNTPTDTTFLNYLTYVYNTFKYERSRRHLLFLEESYNELDISLEKVLIIKEECYIKEEIYKVLEGVLGGGSWGDLEGDLEGDSNKNSYKDSSNNSNNSYSNNSYSNSSNSNKNSNNSSYNSNKSSINNNPNNNPYTNNPNNNPYTNTNNPYTNNNNPYTNNTHTPNNTPTPNNNILLTVYNILSYISPYSLSLLLTTYSIYINNILKLNIKNIFKIKNNLLFFNNLYNTYDSNISVIMYGMKDDSEFKEIFNKAYSEYINRDYEGGSDRLEDKLEDRLDNTNTTYNNIHNTNTNTTNNNTNHPYNHHTNTNTNTTTTLTSRISLYTHYVLKYSTTFSKDISNILTILPLIYKKEEFSISYLYFYSKRLLNYNCNYFKEESVLLKVRDVIGDEVYRKGVRMYKDIRMSIEFNKEVWRDMGVGLGGLGGEGGLEGEGGEGEGEDGKVGDRGLPKTNYNLIGIGTIDSISDNPIRSNYNPISTNPNPNTCINNTNPNPNPNPSTCINNTNPNPNTCINNTNPNTCINNTNPNPNTNPNTCINNTNPNPNPNQHTNPNITNNPTFFLSILTNCIWPFNYNTLLPSYTDMLKGNMKKWLENIKKKYKKKYKNRKLLFISDKGYIECIVYSNKEYKVRMSVYEYLLIEILIEKGSIKVEEYIIKGGDDVSDVSVLDNSNNIKDILDSNNIKDNRDTNNNTTNTNNNLHTTNNNLHTTNNTPNNIIFLLRYSVLDNLCCYNLIVIIEGVIYLNNNFKSEKEKIKLKKLNIISNKGYGSNGYDSSGYGYGNGYGSNHYGSNPYINKYIDTNTINTNTINTNTTNNINNVYVQCFVVSVMKREKRLSVKCLKDKVISKVGCSVSKVEEIIGVLVEKGIIEKYGEECIYVV